MRYCPKCGKRIGALTPTFVSEKWCLTASPCECLHEWDPTRSADEQPLSPWLE